MNNQTNQQEIDELENELYSIGDTVKPAEPPADIADKVMRRIRTEYAVPRKTVMIPFFLVPRKVVPAMTAVLLLLGFFIVKEKIETSKNTPNIQSNDITIDFVIKAGTAESVALIGDFNDWDMDACKLAKQTDGYWKTKLVLKPGRYQYSFVIDGKKYVPDPKAKEYVKDGYGNENSVINVDYTNFAG
jgi:hypothetical protein